MQPSWNAFEKTVTKPAPQGFTSQDAKEVIAFFVISAFAGVSVMCAMCSLSNLLGGI